MDVAKRLDHLIARSGLSNQAVADAAKVSDQTVARWRKGEGKKGPSLDEAIRMAKRLGTTVEYLATGREPVPSELSSDEAFVLQLLRDLNLSRAEAARRLSCGPYPESPGGYAQPIAQIDVTQQAKREFKKPQTKKRVATTKGPSRSTDQAGSDDSSDRSQSAKDTHR